MNQSLISDPAKTSNSAGGFSIILLEKSIVKMDG